MTTTLTDAEVVRWYECERRPVVDFDDSNVIAMYLCPWGDHYHGGILSKRRGPGRRVSNARYHWEQHVHHNTQEATTA